MHQSCIALFRAVLYLEKKIARGKVGIHASLHCDNYKSLISFVSTGNSTGPNFQRSSGAASLPPSKYGPAVTVVSQTMILCQSTLHNFKRRFCAQIHQWYSQDIQDTTSSHSDRGIYMLHACMGY